MTTGTEDRLGELRRRIARLEASAQGSPSHAQTRMQRHFDALRDGERAARASVHQHAAAVDAKLEQLGNEVDIAEHRLQAELADDRREFTDAVEAELHDWDVHLERMQAKAAETTHAARAKRENEIADLRRRRAAVAEALTGARTSTGEGWRDAKKRVLPALDELKRRVDAVGRDD